MDYRRFSFVRLFVFECRWVICVWMECFVRVVVWVGVGLSLVSPHVRINLSPFTKDFRVEAQYNESLLVFCNLAFGRGRSNLTKLDRNSSLSTTGIIKKPTLPIVQSTQPIQYNYQPNRKSPLNTNSINMPHTQLYSWTKLKLRNHTSVNGI